MVSRTLAIELEARLGGPATLGPARQSGLRPLTDSRSARWRRRRRWFAATARRGLAEGRLWPPHGERAVGRAHRRLVRLRRPFRLPAWISAACSTAWCAPSRRCRVAPACQMSTGGGSSSPIRPARPWSSAHHE